LLFSNLELEIPVLTKLDNLIIDEAHNIEDTVTDALKEDYNLRNLKDFFLWLEKIFKAKNFKKIDLITKRDELF
jgi:Rad3-related DNA helicase